MTISNDSVRIQLTLNSNKPKEKIVLDYLEESFNEREEIKRILYEYIVNQKDTKVVKNTKSKKKISKDNKKESKVIKDTTSDKKLLTKSKDEVKVVQDNQINANIVKDNQSDDFTLDLNDFEDKVVEVKKDNEGLKEKKLNALKQFM